MKKTYNYPPQATFLDKAYGAFSFQNVLKIMDRQFGKLGKTYTIKSRLTPHIFIFTKDPKLVEQFMRINHKNYEKSIFQSDILARYLGKGLLTNTGDSWLRQRRLIQPEFNHKKIEAWKEYMLEEIEKAWEEFPYDQEIDFFSFFTQLTFNVIARSLFSSNITQEEIDYIAKTITKSQEIYSLETRNPVYEFAFRKFGVIKNLLKEIEKSRNVIKRIIDERKDSQKVYDDTLDMMMKMRYEDTGEPMEETQLIDELMILMIAGHETTANALSFTFYLLAKNPSVQESLIQQFQKEGEERNSIENIFKPSLAQNVLKESMRLYPPAWVTDRVALKEDKYQEYNWPAKTILIANIFAMNRDPDVWKQPEEFIPTRFEDPEIKKNYFIPFGSGPRFCIGEHFAIMEMQLVLRSYFYHNRFELNQNKLKLKTYVTLRPNKIIGRRLKL